MLAITGGGAGGAPAPAPTPSDKGGVKVWLKMHLQALGRVLARWAGKAAQALPGIIGVVVCAILSALGTMASWVAEHVWVVALAVGALLLAAVKSPPATRKPHRR